VLGIGMKGLNYGRSDDRGGGGKSNGEVKKSTADLAGRVEWKVGRFQRNCLRN
jgi:hypothetical protein